MKPIHIIAALLISAAPVSVPAQPVAPQSAEAAAAQQAAIESALPDIDAMMANFALDSHAPGLSYGIVANGRLVHFKGLGVQDITEKRPVTADSLFRIASMSKAFTALAILKLRDDGKLALDDLAEKHVPEMRGWRYPTEDSPRIRIRDLLSHNAGLVTDNPWGDRQQPMSEAEFTRILKAGVPMSRAPGTAMEYSNFGYALLGRIVTNVSGMPYDAYIRRSILTPLGMRSSGYEVTDAPAEQRAIGYRWHDGAWSEEPTMEHGVFGAMGGLQTSANDYARYVAWLLSAWPARDGADNGPVRRASVRALAEGSNFVSIAPRRGKTGPTACRLPIAYGKGMRVAADCDLGLTLAHSGGYPGYGSYLLLLPEHGIGLFAFSNRTYNAPVAKLWDAAVTLFDAGALAGRDVAVTPMLQAGYEAAGAIFAAGDVNAAADRLAMNFLMDRPADEWREELAGLKAKVGTCDTSAPVHADTAMEGRFTWRCAHGRIEGSLLLAPTEAPTLQELHYSVVAP